MRRTTVLVVAPWTWFLVRDLGTVMELVAVLLPLLVAVAVGLLVAKRQRIAAASFAAFGIVAVTAPWVPHGLGHPAEDTAITIVVANALRDNQRPEDVVDDIAGQHADVVVVPEATAEMDELLRTRFRYALRADRLDSSIGVYANVRVTMPVDVRGPLDVTRQLRAVIEVPGGEDVVLWAVHMPKPWFVATGDFQMRPGQHGRTVDRVLDRVEQEDGPVVVAGDTNLTDRGRSYRKLTDRLDDAMRDGWGGPTARKWYLRPLLLRIDHVFVPEGWCADGARRFPLTGSDHRGVRVTVGPCGD